ncbi:MAG: GDSL-type esterase/lipase family protein [Acidobacteriaceae bacterium]
MASRSLAFYVPGVFVAVALIGGCAGNGGSGNAKGGSGGGGTSSVANLTVSKTHTGDFVQGQQGGTYTITVSNAAGAAATSGTVSVTENPPSGLTLVSLAGSGWSCSGAVCTRSDSLMAGGSYPAITAAVNVAAAASSPQVNQVSVSGGGSAQASASDATTIDTASAILNVSKTHTGDFVQGQQGAPYSITVANASGGGATTGSVTVTEDPPSGLSLVSMSGSGWSCSGLTCTRSDSLAPGSSYPTITATVDVAADASSPQVNQVSVSGGGSAQASASDATIIETPSAILNVSKTHTGDFVQGQQDATYAITVGDATGSIATSGAVTVTENPPSGLSLVSLAGSGWSCSGSSCTRSDSLAPGSDYPVITATVNVDNNATSPQVNQVSVSGGGSPEASASDATTIDTVYGATLIAPPAWQANTAYIIGNVVTNANSLYICAGAGISAASGGPTGAGAAVVADGTASWFYYGTPPTVASPAPTVSQASSVPVALTVSYPADISGTLAPQYQLLGSYPGFVNWGGYLPTLQAHSEYVSDAENVPGVRFVTDAPQFTIQGKGGSNSGLQIMVDGQLLFSGGIQSGGIGPALFLTVDFTNAGGRKARTVSVFSLGGGQVFYGIYVDPASTVSAPPAISARACVFGDSYTAGGGSGAYGMPVVPLDTWSNRALRGILGFQDVWSFAVGGTGYLAGTANLGAILANSGNQANIATCTLIVVNEGVNDYVPYTPSQIQPAVTADVQELRSLVPNVPIVVTGIWGGADGPSAQMIAAEQAIQAGVEAVGDSNTYFIPISTATPPWMTGNGNVTAPNGTGNADVCMGPSGHPTAICEANYMGPRMANALRAVLPQIP